MQITCPKCGASITLEQNVYDSIVNEIRNEQFEKELKKREALLAKEKESDIALAVSKAENQKDKEISELKAKLAAEALNVKAIKDKSDSDMKLALSEKEKKISELQIKLESAKKDSDIAVKTAIQDKEKEIIQLTKDIELEKERAKNNEAKLNEVHAYEVKKLEEEVERVTQFKARESTKQIGEDLEQYCLSEFNKCRAMGFPNAYFEKDNKVSSASNSKGDLIFRDYTEDKIEYISIMFECKKMAILFEQKK